MKAKEREKLMEVQRVLENASMGGVGPNGYTLKEIEEYVEKNHASIEDNSDFHAMQTAWMMIQDLLT